MTEEWPTPRVKYLKPGDALRLFYNPGNKFNRLFHVLAVVEDERDHAVVRYWSHDKWEYKLISDYELAAGIQYFTLNKRPIDPQLNWRKRKITKDLK